MSLQMISDVLALRDISSHCPLCGRKFGRVARTDEHIFPRWLQKHHKLETRRLTLPNFIGKTYKSVRIDICEKCNHHRFGRLETEIARRVRSGDAFAAVQDLDQELLAVWLGKILWLLCRKGHAYPDHRRRNEPEPDSIVPQDLMPGITYLGMMERAFAMHKGMYACYLTDPPLPDFFYGPPYSLYVVEIDTRDTRFEAFDFADNLITLGAALRTGNLGLICAFDGGIHREFRLHRFQHLIGEKLHPVQFGELAARIFYDHTVLHEDALRVQYYWNRPLHAVVAQTQTPRSFDPFLAEHHDLERLAGMIGRGTYADPKKILHEGGRIFTCLEDHEGNFLRYAVTEEEIEAARRDPHQTLMGPLDSRWRTDSCSR
ncbi:HNH endonuclease [Chelativorans intermedius]|uniref:HNH endonuclease n=1 Tax=Chelativorans intermedius TaxID=515947 RepID=A0ABV6DBB8_9HYPH|nr:HNH endonuclease [Chelativorans intermedius]MCT9000239.1 HNH endonuclease [Chelativorans intermedius]